MRSVSRVVFHFFLAKEEGQYSLSILFRVIDSFFFLGMVLLVESGPTYNPLQEISTTSLQTQSFVIFVLFPVFACRMFPVHDCLPRLSHMR